MDLTPLIVSRGFRLLYARRVHRSDVRHALDERGGGRPDLRTHRSPLHIGLVSLARALPLGAGVLVGGVLADRNDRRPLMLATRLPLTLAPAALAANALLPDPQVWLVYVATASTGLLARLGGPAMPAAIPSPVGTERLAAAGALTSGSTQLAALLGPTAGGLLIAGSGLAA
ncbi:MFS transporter [Streptomyces sp. V4I2]|uniref:MFS transporter n=1 Tax=Streptomyces sp. V4I2 TaxID=3042280 RepID=UPI0027D8B157|nr:MFS transporter [Streptomyces sp. V4I2]